MTDLHIDVLFIQCSDRKFADVQMYGFHFYPLWAYTLAAHLSATKSTQHFKVDLFDQRFQELNQARHAKIYLFTGINQDLEAIENTFTSLRQRFPQSVFILGGPITRSFYDAGKFDQLPDFDYFYLGDGELEFASFLAERIGKKAHRMQYFAKPSSIKHAIPIDNTLLRRYQHRYYGGIIEVARGCPFSCNFCDVVFNSGARAIQYKDANLIVQELNRLFDLGIRQTLLACDNIIGKPNECEAILDAIIEWRNTSGKSISLYSWCTINLSRHPHLLRKMRQAGIDMLFIGVESFHQKSLQEANKAQNQNVDLIDAIRTIQAYGIIMVAGLIVGFDSDPEDIFQHMLDSIVKAGLLSGDLSPLIALSGTPLYQQMQSQQRLILHKFALGHYKFETNIIYNRPRAWMIDGFKRYHQQFHTGKFQYQRFANFIAGLQSDNYLDSRTGGYADMSKILRMAFADVKNTYFLMKRLLWILCSYERTFYLIRALIIFFNTKISFRIFRFYLLFWIYNWTNSYLKYGKLKDDDFLIYGNERLPHSTDETMPSFD